MSSVIPKCRTIRVFAFSGDRSKSFTVALLKALRQGKNGVGPGPSLLDCVLFVGHAGVSIDSGVTIHGFNPDQGGRPVWRLMEDLQNGAAIPSIVWDDSHVFTEANKHGLLVRFFDVILPDTRFQDFALALDGERLKSQYSYGFPDGNGDCNCITWLERLGLPLLTGYMNEFDALKGIPAFPSRRFGECV